MSGAAAISGFSGQVRHPARGSSPCPPTEQLDVSRCHLKAATAFLPDDSGHGPRHRGRRRLGTAGAGILDLQNWCHMLGVSASCRRPYNTNVNMRPCTNSTAWTSLGDPRSPTDPAADLNNASDGVISCDLGFSCSRHRVWHCRLDCVHGGHA